MRMGREGREERGRIHHYNWIAHEDGQGGGGGVLDSPLLLDCT